MNKNRKLTRREAHVAHVYATEMYPEEYLLCRPHDEEGV